MHQVSRRAHAKEAHVIPVFDLRRNRHRLVRIQVNDRIGGHAFFHSRDIADLHIDRFTCLARERNDRIEDILARRNMRFIDDLDLHLLIIDLSLIHI